MGKRYEETSEDATRRMTLKELPPDERPRERLVRLGPNVLSASELLAILLRVGVPGENAVQVGQRLLRDFHGILGLQRAPLEEEIAAQLITAASLPSAAASVAVASACWRPAPGSGVWT